MKICDNCNAEVNDNEKFCPVCGKSLARATNSLDKISGYWTATNAGTQGKTKDDCKFFIGTNYKKNDTVKTQIGQNENTQSKDANVKTMKFSSAIIGFILALLLGIFIGIITTNVVIPAIVEGQTYAYSYNGSKWQQNEIDEADYKVIFNEVCNAWKADPSSFSEFKSVGEYMDYMLDSVKSELEQYGDTLKSTYGISDIKSYMAFYAKQLSGVSSASSGSDSATNSESSSSQSGTNSK